MRGRFPMQMPELSGARLHVVNGKQDRERWCDPAWTRGMRNSGFIGACRVSNRVISCGNRASEEEDLIDLLMMIKQFCIFLQTGRKIGSGCSRNHMHEHPGTAHHECDNRLSVTLPERHVDSSVYLPQGRCRRQSFSQIVFEQQQICKCCSTYKIKMQAGSMLCLFQLAERAHTKSSCNQLQYSVQQSVQEQRFG